MNNHHHQKQQQQQQQQPEPQQQQHYKKSANGTMVNGKMQPEELHEQLLINQRKDESPMQIFYKDKGIFLTGGTGFFGKIIIEKLLRVTDVSQIYLLIRMKKGKNALERLDDIFNDPIFDKVQAANPDYRSKITIISGDCSLPNLGISAEERALLRENVNIVLHSAATVRFDEELKIALGINVHGTKEVLKLAKEIQHLKAFVHVSTAFAHCNLKHIQERFYNATITGEKAVKLSECLDEDTLNVLTPAIIKGYPNTYTFTKVLAENIVEQEAGSLPVTIFRPGIVITTYREPIQGWINNMYGPCGVILGIGSGVLRVFSGHVDNKAHIVPVDLCVNALLASAWDIARNTYESPPIYNYVPDPENMVTWRQYMNYGFEYGCVIPLSESIWYPRFTIVPSVWQYRILSFLYHTIPALLIDGFLILQGKQPKMMKIYRKIHKFSSVLSYFSSNEFRFDNDNVRTLSSKLDPLDSQLFAFDMRDLDWYHLFRTSLYGLRLYMAKDDASTIPKSRKRHSRLRVLHYTTLGIIYALALLVIFYFFKLII